jgi:pyridinium-3,5-bisthiocarboxylic acid mononucleotide nickel chelatase
LVRAKHGWRGDGFEVLTPEYEDCARVARERGVPLRAVYEAVRAGRAP